MPRGLVVCSNWNRNGLWSPVIAVCAVAAVAVPIVITIVANATTSPFITESSNGDIGDASRLPDHRSVGDAGIFDGQIGWSGSGVDLRTSSCDAARRCALVHGQTED